MAIVSPFTGRTVEVEGDESRRPGQAVPRTMVSPFTGREVSYTEELPLREEPEPRDELTDSVTLADYGKSIMSGGAGVFAGAGWLAEQFGADTLGNAMQTLGNDAVDYWNDSLSEPAKQELAKEFVTKDENGEWQWGDASLATVGLFGAQSLLGTAAGAGLGAGATKVLQLFANPAGRATLIKTIEAGRGAAAGSAAAAAAGAAASKLKFVDSVMGAAGFGVGEGTIGGASTGVNVEREVMSLSAEQLMENPRFQAIFEASEGLMDEADRFDYAKSTLAKEAGTVSGFQAGLTTALLGAPMGAYFGPLFSRLGVGRTASVLKSAAGEAAQEFAQSGAEGLITNRALIEAGDTERGLFDDVLNQAIGGAAAGALMGAGFGISLKGETVAEPPKGTDKKGTVSLDPLVKLGQEAAAVGATDEEMRPIVEFALKPGGLAPALKAMRELRDAKTEAAGSEVDQITKPIDEVLQEVEETRPQKKRGGRTRKTPKTTVEAQKTPETAKKPQPDVAPERPPEAAESTQPLPEATPSPAPAAPESEAAAAPESAVEPEPSGTTAPGRRWTANTEAEPGEPFAYLDQDPETGEAKAEIVQVENDDGSIGFEARSVDGAQSVRRPTRIGAAAAIEKMIDRPATQETPAESEADPEVAAARARVDAAIGREDVSEALQAMKGEAGWAERGGRMIRKSEDFSSPDYNEVVGRTQWLPKADWWKDRPGNYNEAQTERIIDRGLAGERLGPKQQEYFDYLVETARERIDAAPFMPETDDLTVSGLDQPTQQDADDVALVARATEIDEDAVEQIATRFEEDDEGFRQAIREFLDARAQTPESRTSGTRPQAEREQGEDLTLTPPAAPPPAAAPRSTEAQPDLLGDDTRAAQEMADETRRRDAARNAGQESTETGDPSDMFSQARQQADIDDQVGRSGVEVEQSGPRVPDDTVVDAEGNIVFSIDEDAFAEIIDDFDHVFDQPPKGAETIEKRASKGGFIPLEEAQARVDQWREDALKQGNSPQASENASRTILSLFDVTGNWARPYAEAGYNVLMFDIQSGQDVNDFSVEYFNENYDFGEVYGILAACPCTDFASSGARWFADKDADGRTQASVELVEQTLRTIEYFRPKFWVLENPVGRIGSLTTLPNWRTAFQPHNFGAPYTKKTLLWGKFNAEDMPLANVEPTEGSKMHRLPPSEDRANLRSETPEGFSYSFFKANNFADTKPEVRTVDDYPEAAGAIREAFRAGMSEEEIRGVLRDTYENLEPELARQTLRERIAVRAAAAKEKKAKKAAKPKPENKIVDFGSKIGGARKDTAIKTGKTGKVTSGPGWAKKYAVTEGIKKGTAEGDGTFSVLYKAGSFPRKVAGPFKSRSEAVAAIPLAEVVRNHAVYPNAKKDGTYAIERRVTDRKRVTVQGGFDSRDAAMQYLADNARDIIDWKPPFPVRPHLEKLERSGAEVREGNVAPETFMDAFGFRGGEFGNWLAQDERQDVLNLAYDSLMDMARILDVPPRALSLNGELGIAFGARGQGGGFRGSAAAHYEPEKIVINLTRIKGAGSLAHEWFHALDNYLGRQDTKALEKPGRRKSKARYTQDAYVTHGFGYRSQVREELRDAFRHVTDAIERTTKEVDLDVTRMQRLADNAQEEVEAKLARLRAILAEPRDPKYYRRHNKAASKDQMGQFDLLAARIKSGNVGDDVFVEGRRRFGGRASTEVFEKLSALYKKVRGRTGFAQHDVLTTLYGASRTKKRMDEQVAAAKEKNTATKTVMTDFKAEARTIDRGRTEDYWSTPHELGARAFESYVFDRLEANRAQNDYLVHSVTNDLIEYQMLGLKPYPEGAERERINDAFDALFRTIETRAEGENVALYSRPPPVGTGYESSPGAVREARPLSEPEQHDLFAAPALSPAEKQQEAEANYRVLVRQEAVGTVRVGLDTVSSLEDAAHVLAPFRRHADETMLALVTDAEGKVLNIIRHSKGTVDGASVYPAYLSGSITSTPGAAKVWFGHNHPSGADQPSQADERITRALFNLMEGSGVEIQGHVIVTAGGKMAGMSPQGETLRQSLKIRPAARTKKVEVTERILRGHSTAAPVTRPEQMKEAFKDAGLQDGVLLLNNRHHPVGFVKFSAEELRKLRGTGGLDRLLAAINHTNAAAMGLYLAEGDVVAARNLGNFARQSNIRLLDYVHGHSMASDQVSIQGRSDARFLSRPPPGMERLQEAIDLYLQGQSQKQVGEAVGVSQATIGAWLKKAGVPLRDYRPQQPMIRDRTTPETMDEIERRYVDGESYRQIQNALGVSSSTVNRVITERRIERRPSVGQEGYRHPDAFEQALREEALRLYTDEQMSAADVGSRLGMSQPVVSRIVAEAGTTRTPSERMALRALTQPVERGVSVPHQSTKDGSWHFAQSSYELARMQQLDESPDVIRYTKQVDRVPLDDDRYYVPDLMVFYRDGRVEVEEIKADWKRESADVIEKANAATEFFAERDMAYVMMGPQEIGREAFERLRSADFTNLSEEQQNRLRRALDALLARPEMQEETPLTRRGEDRRGKGPGLSRARIERQLAAPIAAVSPLLTVRVVQSTAELPSNAIPDDIEGAYFNNGAAYLVADNLTPERVEEVFRHEVLGHAAMERHPDFPKWQEQLRNARLVDPRVQKLAAEVAGRQGLLDPVTEAKEIIALMAERNADIPLLKRIIAAIRQFFRDIGLLRGVSDNDIRGWLAKGRRQFLSDAALAEQVPAAGVTAESTPQEILAAIDAIHPDDAIDRPLYARTIGRGRVRGSRAVEDAMGRVMAAPQEDLSIGDRVRRTWRNLTDIQEGRIKQGLLDAGHAIRLLEERQFGQVLDATDSAYKAYLATKNLPSVMAAVMHVGAPDLREGAFQPVEGRTGIIEMFKPVTDHADGNLMALWEFFAAANRASRLIDETNPDGSPREKNFTREDIDIGLALEEQYPFFRDVLNDWQTFNGQILDMAESAGVINGDERALWEKFDYVPFYRALEDGDIAAPRGTGGIADQRSGIRRLTGGEEKIGAVFENMMLNTAHLIDASFKNLAHQRVSELALDTGAYEKMPPQFAPKNVDNRQIEKRLKDAGIDIELTPDERKLFSQLFVRVTPQGPDIVSALWNGKPTYYRVTDPMLASSVSLIGHEQFSTLMNIFRGPKRWLTTGVTASPEFMLANLIRDTLSTWVVSDVPMVPLVDSLKGLSATFKRDKDITAIMMAGAGGGGFYDSSPEDIRKLLAKKMPRKSVDGFLGTVLSPTNIWRFWQRVGASTENATRVAIFRNVLKGGGSIAEAAHQARDVLNFTMSGDFAAIRFLTQAVPFLNARIQGLYRLARGAKAHPKGFTIKGLSIFAATMALLLRNNDREEYEELPEWEKDVYWHVFLNGDGEAVGELDHWRIPKPFEVGSMFATVPERLQRSATGRDGWDLFTERVTTMFAETLALNPTPQLVKPIIEQYANRDIFTGSPIVGLGEMNLGPEAQYNAWTSEFARQMAEAMPDWAPAWLRSPRRLEHAVRAYFGTLGTYVTGVADTATRELGGYPPRPTSEIYDLPIVKRFLRDPDTRYTKYNDMLYDMSNQANALFSSINRYRDQGLAEKAKEMAVENRDKLAARQTLNKLISAIRDINNQQRLVMYSTQLDADEKRRQMDALTRKKNEILRKVAPFEETF